MNDVERLWRVRGLLLQLAPDDPPTIGLGDGFNAGAARTLPWNRGPELVVGREVIDSATDLALLGWLAHELGHQHDRRFEPRMNAIAVVYLIATALAAVLAISDAISFSAALYGYICVLALVFLMIAAVRRASEYRADALGAQIASVEAIDAMLDSAEDKRPDGHRSRIGSLTRDHPSLAMRRAALHHAR